MVMLTVWVVATQLVSAAHGRIMVLLWMNGRGGVLTATSLLRRDKMVVADRVWLTVEELWFLLFRED